MGSLELAGPPHEAIYLPLSDPKEPTKMPFKAPEQIKCPKCDKSVYAAESRKVGELSFHKECFKCSMCNKALDSTNLNCHERVLYCKVCHGRKFGPKGYGFGGGAAGLSMDTGAHLEKQ